MFEITSENALEYLRDRGWISHGPASVESLGWGVSNAVYRIQTAENLFILKQARPQLRTRDLWLSDVNRVFREQAVMELLGPLLLSGVVPSVLFSDRANYVFAMSHAPAPATVWKGTLLAGSVDEAIGVRAGTILGRIHNVTSCGQEQFGQLVDRTVFTQLRIDPFYRRIQERMPEVADAVSPLIEELLSRKDALCHGDYSPKNMLLHPGGFTLVDYETAHLGDPAMDLGFFLSHIILKSIRNWPIREQYYALTRAFWTGYRNEMEQRVAADLETRGVKHFGVCILARIDGTSPVDYLPEEWQREAARRLGRHVLRDPPQTWEGVLQVCEPLCRQRQADGNRGGLSPR